MHHLSIRAGQFTGAARNPHFCDLQLLLPRLRFCRLLKKQALQTRQSLASFKGGQMPNKRDSLVVIGDFALAIGC
jgi:hypothetical protein